MQPGVGQRDLSLGEQPVDGVVVDVDLGHARVRLVDPDRVAAVVLDQHPELGALDAEGGVPGDQDGRPAFVDQVEARREDAMVRRPRVEDLGEPARPDPVELDAQRATAVQRPRRPQPTRPGGAEFLEQADGAAGVGTDLVRPRLVAVELLDDHQGQHHGMFGEAEHGVRIGQQDAGVEYVGAVVARRLAARRLIAVPVVPPQDPSVPGRVAKSKDPGQGRAEPLPSPDAARQRRRPDDGPSPPGGVPTGGVRGSGGRRRRRRRPGGPGRPVRGARLHRLARALPHVGGRPTAGAARGVPVTPGGGGAGAGGGGACRRRAGGWWATAGGTATGTTRRSPAATTSTR